MKNHRKNCKIEANGIQTAEGFVVLQGNHISLVDDDTIPTIIKERMKKLRLMRITSCRKVGVKKEYCKKQFEKYIFHLYQGTS